MNNQWLTASISKEEISQYPPEVFKGRIVVIQSQKEATKAIEALKKESLIGFDTETKPARRKGEKNDISLIQLSSSNTCFLFRTMQAPDMVEALKAIFEDANIMKIGLSLKDDFRGLQQMTPSFNPQNFIELQSYVKQFGIEDNGLSRIYINVFHKRIAKSQRLSNWEADFLTKEQKHYAALDAWATRRIYTELEEFRTNDQYIPKFEINKIINK